jgi:excisionase family DNA binding protein
MSSPTKKYCTPMEAAAILMVSPVTVREWARKGVLPSVSTAGGHRRFLLDELKTFAATHGIHLEEQAAEAAADPMRILLVDDNEIFATYLREIIVHANPAARVEWASDGFEAGQLTEVLRPQLVVVDLQMPRIDGIELCKRLRASPTTAKARIIVLSGALTEERIAAARAAGADDWLGKGASRGEILQALGLAAAPAHLRPDADGVRA